MPSNFLRRCIGWLRNRVFDNTYKGIAPCSPNSFTVPYFTEIGTNIDLIKTLEQKLPTAFNRVLIITDSGLEQLAIDQIYKPLAQKYKPKLMTIDNNSTDNVMEIIGTSIDHGTIDDLIDPWTTDGTESISQHKKRFSALYAFGGGTVIDVTKYAAKKLNLHYICIPTSLAHDGLGSPFAVIKTGQGTKTVPTNMPFGIIIDSNFVYNDPNYERRTRAGVADLISNLTATLDWHLAAELPPGATHYEALDELISMQATAPAEAILQLILEKRKLPHSHDFIKKLAAGLLLSGRAMAEHGSSRPASGFEHKFYHAYNELNQHQLLHGELVAIGTLISSFAHLIDRRRGDYLSILQAFQYIGLPTNEKDLEDLGISIFSIKDAIGRSKGIKPGRYTIRESREPQFLQECFRQVYQNDQQNYPIILPLKEDPNTHPHNIS